MHRRLIPKDFRRDGLDARPRGYDCAGSMAFPRDRRCREDSEDSGLIEGAKLDHPCVRKAVVMSLLGDPSPAGKRDAVAPA
jgi:hypothetical protein